MYINEIEKQTGTRAKTIRFYEEKGLLTSKRSANGYRVYDEEVIHTLKMIKLLRKLGLSIPSIKEWIDGGDLHALLEKQIELNESEKIKQDLRNKLIHEVIASSEIQDIDDKLLMLDEIETEEFAELSKDIALLEQHSLLFYIFQSLIFCGPILWLFYYISIGNYENLGILCIISLLCSVFLTLLWKSYLAHRHEYTKLKKGNGKIALILLSWFFISIFLLVGITWLVETLFIKDDYIMWSSPRYTTYLSFFFMIELFIFVLSHIAKKTKNIDVHYLIAIQSFLRKHKIVLLIVNLVVAYLVLFNHSILYKDHIIVRKWNNPFSTTYTLSNIKQVRCGFHGGIFSFNGTHQGDFYYYIDLKDGTTIDISQPNPAKNEKYEKHTYLEIEEFDAILMKQNIKKDSSEEHTKHNDLASEYKQRFLDIIRNK